TRSKRDWSSDVCSSDLVAHRYPDCYPIKLKGDQLITGLDRVGFTIFKSIIGMDFVVSQMHTGTSNQRGVVHAVDSLTILLHAIGCPKHAYDYCHPQRLSVRLQVSREHTIKLLSLGI